MLTQKLRGYLRTFFGSILPLFVLAHFTHHVITAIAAPLLPLIRTSFSLSYTQSGVLLSSYTIAYGLGHLPAGWLSDRISPVLMIFVGIAGVAIAGVLFGLAPTFALLVVANALIGLTGSGYHPAASYLISRVAKPEQRGSALGVHVIGGSASYFLAPLLAGGIAVALGWRGTFIALSIPTLLLGIALVLLLQRATVKRGISKAEGRSMEKQRRGSRFWIWLFSFLVLSTLSGALVGSTIGFVPLLLVDNFGVRAETAASLLAIVFSGGFWVAPLAGYLSDRVGKLPLLSGACIMVVPTIFLLPRISMGVGLYILLILVGMFVFVRMPVSESFLFAHAPARQRSTLLGVYFLGSNLGGGVFTPVIGWLSDRYGFRYSFAVIALAVLVLTLICGALLAGLRQEGKSSEARRVSTAEEEKSPEG
ncbi:MAG: MFS transporter [Spirochaetaceae bacterium]|nr:MAG: MFS transporter [Spirochaetaceae bacterium]